MYRPLVKNCIIPTPNMLHIKNNQVLQECSMCQPRALCTALFRTVILTQNCNILQKLLITDLKQGPCKVPMSTAVNFWETLSLPSENMNVPGRHLSACSSRNVRSNAPGPMPGRIIYGKSPLRRRKVDVTIMHVSTTARVSAYRPVRLVLPRYRVQQHGAGLGVPRSPMRCSRMKCGMRT